MSDKKQIAADEITAQIVDLFQLPGADEPTVCIGELIELTMQAFHGYSMMDFEIKHIDKFKTPRSAGEFLASIHVKALSSDEAALVKFLAERSLGLKALGNARGISLHQLKGNGSWKLLSEFNAIGCIVEEEEKPF